MGLDAVVYTNSRRLPSTVNLVHAAIDPDTGEVTLDSDKQFIAANKRLGNVSMIAWLSEKIATVLTNIPTSVILTKVLYRGTHVGDVIGAADLPQLQREIEMIREKCKERPAPEIQQFLNDLEELIAAALDQSNPIVFV